MAETTEVPLAVTRLLSARYPTLDVNPEWLRSCVRDLRQRDPALQEGSPDQLARAVRQELLDSDLGSVVAPSYSRLSPERIRTALGAKIGDVGRGTILVQIESMLDIGYSASSQLEIAEARREARRSNMDPNDVPDDVKAALSSSTATPSGSGSADHMADFQAQEEDKLSGSTVYPRRMLKLELWDGSKDGRVSAIELQRIAGLDMNTTKIGCKLLLRGAMVKDGYLLLTPQSVVVEGGGVEAKDAVAEEELIKKLRKQLGKPPLEDRAPSGRANGAAATRTSTSAPVDEERGFNPDEDELDLLADMEAEGAATANTNKNNKAAANRHDRGFSPDEDESYLLAAIEAEEEMMANAQLPLPQPLALRINSISEVATSSSAQTLPPPRKAPMLKIPEGMTQSSIRSQQQSQKAAQMAMTQADEVIMVVDSDEEELFANLPDEDLDWDESGADKAGKREEDLSGRRLVVTASASRDDPIVIESSPEP